MATVRVTLGLSSADVMSTAVGLNVATNLLADSGSIVRAKVKGTAADTDDLVIYKANTAIVAKIGGGEFAFIPVAVDKTYECIATKVNTLIEYGVFGLDNSAVSLA